LAAISLLNDVADSLKTGKFPLSHPLSFSFYVSIFPVTKNREKRKVFSFSGKGEKGHLGSVHATFFYQSVQDTWEVCRTHGRLLAEAKVFVLCPTSTIFSHLSPFFLHLIECVVPLQLKINVVLVTYARQRVLGSSPDFVEINLYNNTM
jgi:hypothetical protein